MCGLTGYWGPPAASADRPPEAVLGAMAGAIAHRGPDADGYWFDSERGVGLGHRRLSILDLSPAGAQPMVSASGRYVIAYNGEIYNHLSLRARLAGEGAAPAWRGHSDTETLLAAIEAWGLSAALREACGMFALALWDRREGVLELARDRTGEKPLYYGSAGGVLLFGSELKAMRVHPAFDGTLDEQSIALFLGLSYIPAPHSIYRGYAMLEPGTIARFAAPHGSPRLERYWSLQSVIDDTAAQRAAAIPFETSVDRLEAVLQSVVEEQMLSDVSLGAFLSGGIDSSLITALMQRASTRPVRTFSIGFADARFNEAPYAAAVATHLGTAHTELTVTEADALDQMPRIAEVWDQPFADASMLPTLLLSRLVRKDVTVALSGDGGDEVFGGYNRHVSGPRIWRRVSRVPFPIRRAGSAGLRPVEALANRDWARRLVRSLGLPLTALDKAGQFADAIGRSETFEDFYRALVATGRGLSSACDDGLLASFARLAPAERMMAWDTLRYLPGDILAKVDRASMAASLETRAPLLDARVISCAWAMPLEHRIGGGVGKRPLRALLERYVPRSITDRPKQGFAIPLDAWLRGPLRAWGEAMLDGYSHHAALAPYRDRAFALWKAHQTGRANNGSALLNALVLADWLKHAGDRPGIDA